MPAGMLYRPVFSSIAGGIGAPPLAAPCLQCRLFVICRSTLPKIGHLFLHRWF
jgi:hypothetical protein